VQLHRHLILFLAQDPPLNHRSWDLSISEKWLDRRKYETTDWIPINFRLFGSVFNIRWLRAETKSSTTAVFDPQYADDAALPALNAHGLQRNLYTMNDSFSRAWLIDNVQKTVVTCQPSPVYSHTVHNFLVAEEPIPQVKQFTYLGSILYSSCSIIIDEIQNRILQATAAFARLGSRVFLNRNLPIKAKVVVYSAICISTLLYGNEVWTLYRAQVRCLEIIHFRCFQRILGINWKQGCGAGAWSPHNFGLSELEPEPKIFRWLRRCRILKCGFWFHSPSLWSKRVVQIMQWFVFSFQWTNSFWSRSQKLLDIGARAGAWNLSSGSTALPGRAESYRSPESKPP